MYDLSLSPGLLDMGPFSGSEELEPVREPPVLVTSHSVGFKLYGKSDYDAATESFMTTYYFVAFYLPLLPLARYRVVREDSNYWFLGKGKLRAIDRLHVALFAGLLSSLIAAAAIS